MAGYEAGSVTAKVILDTKEFNEAIGKLKEEVSSLKSEFSSVKGSNGLSEEVKQLKADMEKLSQANEDYKKTLKSVRDENETLVKSNAKLTKELERVKKAQAEVNTELKTEQKNLDNASKSASKYVKLADRMTKWSKTAFKSNLSSKGMGDLFSLGAGRGKYADFSQWIKGLNTGLYKVGAVINKTIANEVKAQQKLETLKLAYYEYSRVVRETEQQERLSWQRRTSAMRIAMEAFVGGIRNAEIQMRKSFATEGGMNNYYKTISRLRSEFGKVNNINFTKLSTSLEEPFLTVQSRLTKTTTLFKTEYKIVDGEIQSFVRSIGRVSDVLKKLDLQLLASANKTKSYFEALKLASNMWKMNTQGTANWQGRQQYGGYSNYLSQVTKVNQALGKQTTYTRDILGYQSKFAQGNEKSVSSLRRLTGQLNSSSNATNTLRRGMQYVDKEALRARYGVDSFGKGVRVAGNYTKISKDEMDKMGRSFKSNDTNVRKLGRGITSFNNGIVQTAHSGRILSNTLYQIRGALLSLKMIFTAMGGMMLWGFAMDIAESVKETVTAKNEMEAQLNQNSKVDASGIQYFRKELDKLTTTFKKVNKYTVGETVSSIGLEFNLTAKQMADALPIVTMIQSEYVRAGRKTSEAALAVKDILQGEFQRLSRETGVGKEELVAYGWDEDKTNIDGLLKALNKAALDRHWDIFAKKATSLNDVIEITKSRFSELGADVVDSITPAIVGGFNAIIDTINSLSSAFNSMDAFGKNFTFFGGTFAGITGILTVLPMVTKGMGLAEIATLGWGKSVLTAVFNLNKAEVGMYGFRKALAAVITGTKASEIANIRTTKAIMGRVLGLNQVILKEKGYGTAMVASKLALKEGVDMTKVTMLTELTRSQRLAYLTTNIKYNEAAELSRGKAILKTVTSVKLLRAAFLGIMAIGIIAYAASVGAWAETVKKRVEAFNDVLATGKDKIKEYAKDTETYTNSLSKLKKGTEEYARASRNANVSASNKQDMEQALKLAKAIQKTDKQTAKDHDLSMKSLLNQSYAANGVKNVEEYGQKYFQMRQVAYDIAKSESERAKFQYQSLQHINEHVNQMKKAGVAEKDRVKYITEYSTKAEEAAANLKKFNQGDMSAGFAYLMNRAELMWIDLWNDKDFINFWNAVKKTFNDLKPTLKWLGDTLSDIGRTLIKYFSTEQGRWVGAISAGAIAVGLLGYKFKDSIKSIWNFGKAITGRIKDLRGLKKASEETSDVLGKSTGGIAGDTKGKSWAATTGEKLKSDATNYARGALAIAAGMVLIGEAIALLMIPMGALAATGWAFKQLEPNIRKGIDGLKLIAPVMAVMLPPVVALMYIMQRYGSTIQWETMGDAFLKSAVGIAMGITLVTEAIFLLNAPMIAIGSLGWVYGNIKKNVKQGIEAIKATNEALFALVPWIPVFAAGIVLGAMAFSGVGAVGFLASALGIAMGITLVTEAIYLLTEPLIAISALGVISSKLPKVKEGAEAIRVTAEALTYVSQAFVALSLVSWTDLGNAILQIIKNTTGVDLTTNLSDLTKEGGFIDQLNTFVKDLNKKEFEPLNQDKVDALKSMANGMQSISDAMQSVKTMMDNLPPEFKGETSSDQYGRQYKGAEAVSVEDYFGTFKKPLQELSKFIKWFNSDDNLDFKEGISSDKVQAINDSANMLTSLDTAVNKVKDIMDTTWSSDFSAGISQKGLFGAVGDFLFGGNGATGDYVSSMGSSFQEMENIIKDMVTFNNNISGLGTEGKITDVSGLVTMVQNVSAQINNLKNTITNAVPQLKTNAKGLGSAIGDGLKQGYDAKMASITPYLGNKVKVLGTSTLVPNFKTGIDKMNEVMGWELYYVGKAIDDHHDELVSKAGQLATDMTTAYQNNLDMHSPGFMARLTGDEMGFIGDALQTGINTLPSKVGELANALTSNFNFDLNIGDLKLPNLEQFQQGISNIPSMVANAKVAVSSEFSQIQTNVGNSFSAITSKTRTSMSNMYNGTVKHIANIKTSWRGMQTALIASAEHIRSQTTSKINKLKSNLGAFWNKIKHPDQLISGSAGAPVKGTRPRRYAPKISTGYAGSPLFKPKISTSAPDDNLKEYLQCMFSTGNNCYAGGWSFDWTNKISNKFNGWKTHFNKFNLDSYLNVGKFKSSNFPVKGIKSLALDYISEVIKSTTYDFYFNQKYDTPADALRAGHFNCFDGTRVILALAEAFGFGGGGFGHGIWNGVGHVWASIPGLGIIDPTALQRGYGLRSPKVKGYGAGSPKNSGNVPVGGNNTYNNHFEINVYGDDVEVDNRRIDKDAGRKILDILGINPATGR